MKLNLTLRKITEIMQGKLVGGNPDEKVLSFVTDSRIVSASDAFIALKGQNFDARQFIPQVLEKGARVVVAQEQGFTVPTNTSAAFILVKDPRMALQELAKYHRLQHTLKLAAITGSNGKSVLHTKLLRLRISKDFFVCPLSARAR